VPGLSASIQPNPGSRNRTKSDGYIRHPTSTLSSWVEERIAVQFFPVPSANCRLPYFDPAYHTENTGHTYFGESVAVTITAIRWEIVSTAHSCKVGCDTAQARRT
jgi:hypothetical protein